MAEKSPFGYEKKGSGIDQRLGGDSPNSDKNPLPWDYGGDGPRLGWDDEETRRKRDAELQERFESNTFGGELFGDLQARQKFRQLAQTERDHRTWAQNREGVKVDYKQADEDRGYQIRARSGENTAAGLMLSRAVGNAPSIAEMQAARDSQRLAQQQASAVASARGPAALAMAQQNAAANTAAGQSAISQDAQVAAARERLEAEQAAAGAYGAMRGRDLGAQAQSAQQSQYQAQMTAAQRALNDQYDYGRGQLALGYERLGFDVGKEQLDANMRMRQLEVQQSLAQEQREHESDMQTAGKAWDLADFSDVRAKDGVTPLVNPQASPTVQGMLDEGADGGGGGLGAMIGGAGMIGMFSDERAKMAAFNAGRQSALPAPQMPPYRGLPAPQRPAPMHPSLPAPQRPQPPVERERVVQANLPAPQLPAAQYAAAGNPTAAAAPRMPAPQIRPPMRLMWSDRAAKEEAKAEGAAMGFRAAAAQSQDPFLVSMARALDEPEAKKRPDGTRGASASAARPGRGALARARGALSLDEKAALLGQQVDAQNARLAASPTAVDATRAFAAMAPSAYRYKPGLGTPGVHVGPMAQSMASNPVTATAVERDPQTGLLALDQEKSLKLAMGGVGHLAQQQSAQQAQINALSRAVGRGR